MSPLADLIMDKYGIKSRAVVDPLGVSPIGVNPVLGLHNNPNRLGFIIMNLSANIVYAHLTQDVNAGAGTEVGIRIDPNGGYLSMSWLEDLQMVGWAWWLVSSGAGSRITILENVEI